MWLMWTVLGLAALATPVLVAVTLFRKGKALVIEIRRTAELVGDAMHVSDEPAVRQVASLYHPETRANAIAERKRLKDAANARRHKRLTAAAARWEQLGLVGRLPVTMGGRPTGGAR